MSEAFDPQQTRTELRQTLRTLIYKKFGNQLHFAPYCGIAESQLSKIFTGRQGMSRPQLDAITAALDLPEGHFYPLFKGECFRPWKGMAVLHKCTDFMQRCLQLGLDDVAHELFPLIIQTRPNKPRDLLPMIESLYDELPEANTLPYYQAVIRVEEKMTETLVIAYYRQFLLLRQQGAGWKVGGALFQLLPHLHRLPERYTDSKQHIVNLKRDAYQQILGYFQQIEEWNDLLFYTKEWEKWAIQAGDDEAADEARHYQALALRGQGKVEEVKGDTGGVLV